MKKLLLALIASICFSAEDSKTYHADIVAIHKLVEELAKPYDFADTIKTLIYIESRNGLYPVNVNDPSCGVTHINIDTYMKRHKIKNTAFNRNKACSDLIESPKWAILNAIEELVFWKQIHCGKYKCTNAQYRNVVKSYNAGWSYKGKKAQEYWEKFRKAYKKANEPIIRRIK